MAAGRLELRSTRLTVIGVTKWPVSHSSRSVLGRSNHSPVQNTTLLFSRVSALSWLRLQALLWGCRRWMRPRHRCLSGSVSLVNRIALSSRNKRKHWTKIGIVLFLIHNLCERGTFAYCGFTQLNERFRHHFEVYRVGDNGWETTLPTCKSGSKLHILF